ncbi:YciI family protein [Herbiconiux moechotypicola]|uniref:YciI family protein n=1 Tax=Herbiconiux moechotypicola TaxID=637393 RepID=A0ABP5QRJ3_9MICO|nr:YciI family protein [Herbiconiux moechotypicola]MCS5730653.1 YciI family protein [Herbiconiux moechotypicola]
MEYMILINGDESAPRPSYGEPGYEEFMATWLAYTQRLIDGGHWVSGANLHPSTTATTIARGFGTGDTLLDGPYAETKEQLAGYYLIRAADLDEALQLAAAIPLPAGAIEVRPVSYRPDAS